jgi:hypothetical protein
MNYKEIQIMIQEFEKIGFKVGLSIWIEGAHSFYGNLRLLLDPYLMMEKEDKVHELIDKYGLKLGFVGRGETTFVLIY